jgi:hypothetical protein
MYADRHLARVCTGQFVVRSRTCDQRHQLGLRQTVAAALREPGISIVCAVESVRQITHRVEAGHYGCSSHARSATSVLGRDRTYAGVSGGTGEAVIVTGERIQVWAKKACRGKVDGGERSKHTIGLVHRRLNDVVINGNVRKSEQQVACIRQQSGHCPIDGPRDFYAKQR